MKLESYHRKAVLITPQGEVTHRVEHRRDPLTGRISTICPDLKGKWSSFVGETDYQLVEKMAQDSSAWCPFCKPIEEVTPTVHYTPEGRWHCGDIWVFPNLYPRTEFEAVITSCKTHFVWLDGFSPEFVYTHLKTGIQCIGDVFAAQPALSSACIGWNFLPSAGASLVHPHLQVSMRDIPFNFPAFIEEKSREYYEKEKRNFWGDIITRERHIATLGRTEWVTPYAPSGFNEVWGMVRGASNFCELEDEDLLNVGEGISRVLQFYHERKCSAFNMLFYSGKLSERNESFWCGVRLVSRPNLRPVYLSIDSWYMPKMLWEEVVAESPEELAEAVRKYFQ